MFFDIVKTNKFFFSILMKGIVLTSAFSRKEAKITNKLLVIILNVIVYNEKKEKDLSNKNE